MMKNGFFQSIHQVGFQALWVLLTQALGIEKLSDCLDKSIRKNRKEAYFSARVDRRLGNFEFDMYILGVLTHLMKSTFSTLP